MSTPQIPEEAMKAAWEAFRLGGPGVLRQVKHFDSYPGERRGDPDAYAPLLTSPAEERRAILEVLEAAYPRLIEHFAREFERRATECKLKERPQTDGGWKLHGAAHGYEEAAVLLLSTLDQGGEDK